MYDINEMTSTPVTFNPHYAAGDERGGHQKYKADQIPATQYRKHGMGLVYIDPAGLRAWIAPVRGELNRGESSLFPVWDHNSLETIGWSKPAECFCLPKEFQVSGDSPAEAQRLLDEYQASLPTTLTWSEHLAEQRSR
jgi:hypothetical protein